MREAAALRNGECTHRAGKTAGHIRGRESMSDRKGANGGAESHEVEQTWVEDAWGKNNNKERDSGGDTPGGPTRSHTEHEG